jgi:ataxin-10
VSTVSIVEGTVLTNLDLREHALFTIRNLMRDNLANQAVVKEMDPVGVVSDSGEVLPLPEKLKKQTAQLEEL